MINEELITTLKSEYYEALDAARQADRVDGTSFAVHFMSFYEFLQTRGFVGTAEAARQLGLTLSAVQYACQRGMPFGLEAIKIPDPTGRRDGLWLATQKSVDSYPQRRRLMKGQKR